MKTELNRTVSNMQKDLEVQSAKSIQYFDE